MSEKSEDDEDDEAEDDDDMMMERRWRHTRNACVVETRVDLGSYGEREESDDDCERRQDERRHERAMQRESDRDGAEPRVARCLFCGFCGCASSAFVASLDDFRSVF